MRTRCGLYAECDSCINAEHDPFVCDDCEDASNYEPMEEQDISLMDLVELMKEAA